MNQDNLRVCVECEKSYSEEFHSKRCPDCKNMQDRFGARKRYLRQKKGTFKPGEKKIDCPDCRRVFLGTHRSKRCKNCAKIRVYIKRRKKNAL